MVGKEVTCKVRSGNGQVYTVHGIIERECNNRGIYILRLSHALDIVGNRSYNYAVNDTMLVTQKEIV
jgi:hypothetical protein